ncbi:MAG: hypothetical protein KKB31_00275, partial [Nanoarchaeota archaeon]|nr:hypothetical protein [Nanoarchaeota archaeon]
GDILIKDNKISNINGIGIDIGVGSIGIGNLTVQDNNLTNCSGYYLKITESYVSITNNRFIGNDAARSTSIVLLDSGSNYINFNGNTLFNFVNITGDFGGSPNACFMVGGIINASYNNFTDCDIAYTFHSSADNSQIWNDIITNSTDSDFYNTISDNIQLYNVTFNKSKADFLYDNYGYYEVFNYFKTNVTDTAYSAIESASVNITDQHGTNVDSQFTDVEGLTDWRWIMEYKQTGDANYVSGCIGSGVKINCSTPHTITASKTGYAINTTIATIDDDFIYHIILGITANESEGRNAITEGINNVIPYADIYTDLEIDVRYFDGTQNNGVFDKVAFNGSQRWGFNYVTDGESFTNMDSSSYGVFNVWEDEALAFSEIVNAVEEFINSSLF